MSKHTFTLNKEINAVYFDPVYFSFLPLTLELTLDFDSDPNKEGNDVVFDRVDTWFDVFVEGSFFLDPSYDIEDVLDIDLIENNCIYVSDNSSLIHITQAFYSKINSLLDNKSTLKKIQVVMNKNTTPWTYTYEDTERKTPYNLPASSYELLGYDPEEVDIYYDGVPWWSRMDYSTFEVLKEEDDEEETTESIFDGYELDDDEVSTDKEGNELAKLIDVKKCRSKMTK